MNVLVVPSKGWQPVRGSRREELLVVCGRRIEAGTWGDPPIPPKSALCCQRGNRLANIARTASHSRPPLIKMAAVHAASRQLTGGGSQLLLRGTVTRMPPAHAGTNHLRTTSSRPQSSPRHSDLKIIEVLILTTFALSFTTADKRCDGNRRRVRTH